MRRFLVSALVLFIACDNEPTTPTTATVSFSVVSGDGQSGTVGQPLANPLVIKATDSKGKAIRNLVIEFRVTSGGGSTSPATATTNNQGFAQTSWTLGTSTADTQRVEARAVSTGQLFGSFTATTVAGPPAAMAMNSADSQTTNRLTAVPIPPAVRITDQYGNPVPGKAVTFTIPFYDVGGSVTGSPAVSNADGIATLGSWVVGSAVGRHWVQARIPELAYVVVTFTAVGTLENGARMAEYHGSHQVTKVNVAFPLGPAVRITDASGNPIEGVRPTWTQVQGSGSLAGGSNASGANGVADYTTWTPCCTRGTIAVRVTLNGSPDTVVISSIAEAGPAATVAVQAGSGQSAYPNAVVAIAPAAVVRDTFGNPVPRVTVDFAVTAGGGSVSGTPVTTDTNGIAMVGSWRLGPSAGSNTLNATASGVSGAATFTATGVAPVVAATKSTVTVSPLSIIASSGAITSTITVTARDTNSNPVPGATVTLTVAGTGNTITQPVSVTDDNGVTTGAVSSTVAEFKHVWATINGRTTFPTTVEVTGGPPVSMVVYAGDNQVATVGTALAVIPQVLLRDQFGNGSYGTVVTWEVTGGGGGMGSFNAGTTPGGVSTGGIWTLGAAPGLNTLQAAVQGTPLAVTFSATGDASFWTSHAALPTFRFVLGAAAANGLVYAVGGMNFEDMATVEAYDPATNTWGAREPLPSPRSELSVAVVNNVLYAIGGIRDRTVVGTVEAYDPVTDSWMPRAPMPTPRADVGVAVVNGIIYTIGGASATSSSVGTVEAYDPATDTWTTKAPMPTPRLSLGAAEVGGLIYAIGGTSDASFWMATVEAYDPVSDTWTTKAPMPTPRFGLGVAAIDGRVYALGGYIAVENYATLTTILEAYDPTTNTWVLKPAMLTPRVYGATAVLQGLLYVVGGMGDDVGSLEVFHPSPP
jgi:energy-converting hydrogenase Eha subunit A